MSPPRAPRASERVRSWLLQPTGRRVVLELQGDQYALERSQHSEADDQRKRNEHDHENPDRRLPSHIDDQGEPDHEEARDQRDEYRRPVAGIGEAEIEPADLAFRRNGQKAVKQPAFAATRASAGEARRYRGNRGVTAFLDAHAGDSSLAPRPREKVHGGGSALSRQPRPRSGRPRNPRHRCRRTGTATPRRRNASTRPRIRSPDAVAA